MPYLEEDDLPPATAPLAVNTVYPVPRGSRAPHARRHGLPARLLVKGRLTGALVRIRPEGYGFIHSESDDYYVNINSMCDRAQWKEGTRVSFLPGAPKPGKAPPAYEVKALDQKEGSSR